MAGLMLEVRNGVSGVYDHDYAPTTLKPVRCIRCGKQKGDELHVWRPLIETGKSG